MRITVGFQSNSVILRLLYTHLYAPVCKWTYDQQTYFFLTYPCKETIEGINILSLDSLDK